MFRSATFKLTLWYIAIVMSISLLFSIALYNVTTHELDRGLQSESRSLYNQFPIFQNDPRFGFKPNTYYDDSTHRILLRLIGFNMIVLVAAGFTSYGLARRTLRPIEEAHEQQKRFTSDVSHELRTPLTAIKMESEVALLKSKADASELRGTIKSNLEEVAKLESLINNLLRLTRLDADEVQHIFTKVNSKDIVSQAVDQVKKTAENHKISINVNVSNASLVADKESLSQLLVILLDNAIKYSPKDSSVLVESIPNKDNVIWKIKDEGSGIDPKHLDHVFDRFYRADSSRTKNGSEGYGLGLSIAKMIADIHQGTITISSKLKKGTTVTVIIPKNTVTTS